MDWAMLRDVILCLIAERISVARCTPRASEGQMKRYCKTVLQDVLLRLNARRSSVARRSLASENQMEQCSRHPLASNRQMEQRCKTSSFV